MTAGSRYLDHLPLLYRDDPLLGKFLLAFEHILTGGDPSIAGLEAIIDGLDRFVRPGRTSPPRPDDAPAEFLPWLAAWVGFSFRHEWSERQRRNLLTEARWLHDRRGTAVGLRRFLELALAFDRPAGGALEPAAWIENGPDAGFFSVTVHCGSPDPDDIRRALHVAREVIDRERPAHTWYRLDVRAPMMRIINEPTTDRPGIRVGHTLLGNEPDPPPDSQPDSQPEQPDKQPEQQPEQPEQQPDSPTEHWVGAADGDAFDDSEEALRQGGSITRLKVRSGNIIDGVQTFIGDQEQPWHGGDGGSDHDIVLDPGDALTAVSGYYGTWFGQVNILQLSFTTRRGAQHGPFGDMAHAQDASPFELAAGDGQEIAALFGSTRIGGSVDGILRPYLARLGVVFKDSVEPPADSPAPDEPAEPAPTAGDENEIATLALDLRDQGQSQDDVASALLQHYPGIGALRLARALVGVFQPSPVELAYTFARFGFSAQDAAPAVKDVFPELTALALTQVFNSALPFLSSAEEATAVLQACGYSPDEVSATVAVFYPTAPGDPSPPDPASLRRSAAAGDPGAGDPFDDTDLALRSGAAITRLRVRAGQIVDGIQALLGDVELPWHGGAGGEVTEAALGPGDVLIEVSGLAEQWDDRVFIHSLSFRTREGVSYGPFGSPDAANFCFTAEEGEQLVALFGATATLSSGDGPFLTSIGAVFRRDG